MKNICILNASNPKNIHLEADEYVDLRDRKSCFKDDKIIKQCRSWHSWAYALETEFFVYNKQGWPGIYKYDNIVILVNRDISEVYLLIERLQKMGKNIAIAYHEGIGDLIQDSNKWMPLQDVVKKSGTFLNFIGHYRAFFEGMFQDSHIIDINHTNPFDWIPPYIKTWEEKTGDILIGTRTLNQRLSRNTMVTLATVSGWQRKNPNRKIDWISEDGGDVQNFLNQMGFDNVTLHKGPYEYNEWLKFLSNYKYIVHHDLSMNLGQISLDALMIDAYPVGGTTWVNRTLATADKGSTYGIINKFELEKFKSIEDNKKYAMNLFHPDVVKKELEEVFK